MNKRSGIYLVQPQQSELKIIYNQNDANKVGNYETILKVNKNNSRLINNKIKVINFTIVQNYQNYQIKNQPTLRWQV